MKSDITLKQRLYFMTTYKDGKWNGPFKAYYKNGKIWREDNRENGKIEGKAIEYTPNGDTAKIEEWKNSKLFNQIVFYQSTKKHYQKYHLVSREGFPMIVAGKNGTLGYNTTDSLIESGPDCEYIWLNGKRQLFSGKEPEKIIYKIIKTGEKPGYYRIQGEQSDFIRPLTKEEMK